MGIRSIIAGMIFLFNPFISVYDILPDFIGYMFIIYGLYKIADVELKVREARRRMTQALYVAVGRFAIMMSALFMEFDSTLVLVFTFSFAVLEIFFVLPAFNMFFESLEYSCMRFSEKASIKKAEDLTKMTPVFLIIRSAAAVIPELTSLATDYGYVGDDVGLKDSGVIRIMLIAICVMVAFVFGVVWLSMVLGYLGQLRKNVDFLDYIKEKYETTVLTDKVLQMQRSVKRFTAFWFAAMFFVTCISFDGYYIIPEFVCAVLVFFAFMYSRRYNDNYKKTVILNVAAVAAMFAAYALLFRYSSEMGYIFYPYKAEGFWGYFLPYIIFAVAGYFMLILLCKKSNKVLKNMIEDCVGVRGTSDERRKEIDEYRKKELCKYADRLFVLQTVAFGGSIVFMVLMPWFDLAWTARTVLSVIAIIYSYNVMSDINEEAEKAL